MSFKILSRDEQIKEYFIQEAEKLTREVHHSGPRPDDGYDTIEFNKKRATELFNEIKDLLETEVRLQWK